MKRRCALLLCGLLALLFCLPSAAAESGSRSLQQIEASYTVAQDGSCQVELTLHPGADVGSFEFPIPAQAKDISAYPGGSLRRDGQTLYVSISATQEAHIQYRLAESASASAAGQHLTLRLLLPSLDYAVEQYSAVITLPKRFEALPEIKSGYLGENIDNYLELGIQEGVVTMQTTQALRDHESLDFSLELPTGYFDLRFLAGKTALVDTILFWLLLAAAAAYWFFFLRNRFAVPKQQTQPPLSGNAGVTPYLLTGDAPDLALLTMQWASLGYLAIARTRKGKLYLKKQMEMGSERKDYEQRAFNSIFGRTDLCSAHSAEYRQARENFPTLARGCWETQIFAPKGGKALILRLLGVGCGLALGLRCFDAIVAAQSWRWFLIIPLTLLSGLACWLLQPAATFRLHRKRGRTLLLALLALLYLVICGAKAGLGGLLFVCVLVQLLIGLGLLYGGKRTKQGTRLSLELLGLRRYLAGVSPETVAELLADDPQFYYRMLPYADALCIGGRFTGKFAGIRIESCTWLTAEGAKPQSAASFWSLYRLVMDELHEQVETPVNNLLINLRRGKRR